MNKKTLAIVSTILLLVAFALISTAFNKSQDSSMTTENSNNSTDKMVAEDKAMTTKKVDSMQQSRYQLFENGLLEKVAVKRIVLFFYASWCPTCRPTDADLTTNTEKLPKDVVVIRVNYNDPETEASERELARKYTVTYQHTFVQIDKDGREVKKWNGGSVDELLDNIAN